MVEIKKKEYLPKANLSSHNRLIRIAIKVRKTSTTNQKIKMSDVYINKNFWVKPDTYMLS